MKAIIISIQPHFVEKILNGEKTIEIRKTKPSCELPVKVYIYCTKGKGVLYRTFVHFLYNSEPQNGKVVAEFTLNEVECFTTDYRRDRQQTERIVKESCVDFERLMDYETDSPCLYAWHIDDLKIYDTPKQLGEFHTICKENNCFYCPYHYHENNASIGIEEFCMSDGLKPLTRPFASWGYCEELEEGNG